MKRKRRRSRTRTRRRSRTRRKLRHPLKIHWRYKFAVIERYTAFRYL